MKSKKENRLICLFLFTCFFFNSFVSPQSRKTQNNSARRRGAPNFHGVVVGGGDKQALGRVAVHVPHGACVRPPRHFQSAPAATTGTITGTTAAPDAEARDEALRGEAPDAHGVQALALAVGVDVLAADVPTHARLAEPVRRVPHQQSPWERGTRR